MEAPVFIGKELDALGYRLAGFKVLQPAAGELATAFQTALIEAPLVIVGADAARSLPEARLRSAMRAADPPVVVVPGVDEEGGLPDMEKVVRTALGVSG